MVSKNIEKLINEQINKEFYSAYFYLSIEAYLRSINLDGFANFFRVQVQEERDHAMLFFNFLNHINGNIKLEAIATPPFEFKSPEEVFELALKHEYTVTESIYNIVNAAVEEKDHKTNTFLQWFVTEQAEEESNIEKYLKKIQLVGEDGRGILLLDQELAARVYTPPTLVVQP